MQINPERRVSKDDLETLKLEDYISFSEFEAYESHRNLPRLLQNVIPAEKLIQYKPNDLTVVTVWLVLAQKVGLLSDKTVAIIGCGNIGFKLALKLAESSANIRITRRNRKVGNAMVNAVNLVKPGTAGSALLQLSTRNLQI